MTGPVTRRETCRLCGGVDHELALKMTPVPVVDAYVPADRLAVVQEPYPTDVYLCRGCGHAQLLDVVDPELLYGDYIYVTASSLGLVAHFDAYAGEVIERVGPPNGSLVVDIGSNDGSLLRTFQRKGMAVLGIDPAREIAREATESGVETLPVFFTGELARSLREERGPAGIVTVNNLFANVDDLSDMVAGIRTLLAPDGVFVFETFYLVDLIQNMVFDFVYHEHLNCFTVGPLVSFFKRHNMELIDVQRVPTKGGSLRCTAQLAGGARKVAPIVGDLMALEDRLGIHKREVFDAFAVRVDEAREATVDMLRGLRQEGKSIAGYGASATTTPLMYHFGITEMIDFLVDDSPARQGLYSPGCHIPVYPADALYERKPDCVLVMAWRYVDPIVSKHQAYLDQGGRFIVPLPRIEVI